MPTQRYCRILRALAIGLAPLMAIPAAAQSSTPAPSAPPPDMMILPPEAAQLPVDAAPAPAQSAPAANPSDQASRTAAEAFSSLGGFGVGPGGGIGALLSPTVGNMPVRASLAFSWFPSEEVHFQPASLGSYREDFAISAPIWQDDRNEWSLSTNLRAEEFQTDAILPTTHQAFPDQLVDVRFGTSYRHEFDNDWIAGVGVSFGSASDEPFHSINELTGGVNAFLRVPQGDRNAWLFTISYSTNAQINIPIPGVAYLWWPTDYFQAVIGFPFASINYRPTEDLTLSVSYALLTTVHARATYRLTPALRVYAAFDWDNESYFRVGREDDEDRFFYYEKRASTGVQYTLGPRTNLDLSGGYAFDRFYFEGQSLNDDGTNRVDVGNGPYVSLKLLFHY
jgi:hypothetical protein